MAGKLATPMQPGHIFSEAGANTFRGELLSARPVRCANLWMALCSIYSDGAAEIELLCSLDPQSDRWEVEVYYYSFEQAVTALREYEHTGNFPEGE